MSNSPIFTRRHYRMMALWLNTRYHVLKKAPAQGNEQEFWMEVEVICRMFAVDNKRFDRERFIMWVTE